MNTVRVGSAVAVGAFVLLVGLLLMYQSSNSELKSQVETLNQKLVAAEETMHEVGSRSAECEKEVLTKHEAGEEMAAAFEECKVGRKKSEEEVISWKKRLEELQKSEAAANSHVQELHSKVDELEADNEHLNDKIRAFGECNKEKDLAVRNHEVCKKELLSCKTASAGKLVPGLHSQSFQRPDHSEAGKPGSSLLSHSLHTHDDHSTDKELPKVNDGVSDGNDALADEDNDALADKDNDALADKDNDALADKDNDALLDEDNGGEDTDESDVGPHHV